MTAGADIEVDGGVGGMTVALAEMEEAARRLHAVAGELAHLARDLLVVGLDPAVVAATTLAPEVGLGLQLRVDQLAGPAGVGGESLVVAGTARSVSGAVAGYRQAEARVRRSVDSLEVGSGLLLGLSAPAVAPAVAVAIGLAGPEGVDRWLFDHPWVVPSVTDGLEGVVLGLGLGSPLAGAWLAGQSLTSGRRYPPATQEEALDVVIAAAGGAALDESGHRVRVQGGRPRPGTAPTSVADLVSNDGPVSGEGRVRVTRVARPDGTAAWVVDIPGTSTFDPRAGAAPFDLTSAVKISAGQETLTTRAVTAALADAQHRMGGPTSRQEPILFSGHSQGGMTAAALAASPRVRTRFPGVSHVVTSGAPIARSRLGPDLSVLAIEHRQDPVVGLDGRENPDRRGWVTVTRDVEEDLGPQAGATAAHDAGVYTDTADLVDRSLADDVSLRHWHGGADPFLAGGRARTIDYEISRSPR